MKVADFINQDNWPTDVDDARAFGLQALKYFRYRDQVPKLTAAVQRATTVQRIQHIIINAILSGEGYRVIKL